MLGREVRGVEEAWRAQATRARRESWGREAGRGKPPNMSCCGGEWGQAATQRAEARNSGRVCAFRGLLFSPHPVCPRGGRETGTLWLAQRLEGKGPQAHLPVPGAGRAHSAEFHRSACLRPPVSS